MTRRMENINAIIIFLILLMLSIIMVKDTKEPEQIQCGEITIKMPMKDIKYYKEKTFGDINHD